MAGLDRLQGVMVALATPLNEDESVDETGLRRQVRRLIEAGVHVIVALGTAGEFAALSEEAKRDTIAIAVDEAAGEVPVIAGTGEPGTRRAVSATQRAAELGADAAMVVPPYYYRNSDETVLAHYAALADEGGLPIVLYNIPAMTKTQISPQVVAELAPLETVLGLKDSGGDLRYFQQLVAECGSPGFGLVTGSDGLLYASLSVGGDGCVSPGTNIAPEWFVGLWDAFRAGQLAEAWELQTRILGLGAIHRHGAFPAGLKGALAAMGICGPTVHAPLRTVGASQVQEIGALLRELALV